MEELIKLLINSNLKLVSKDTGIPYDRMYKWVKGKATPKTNDYSILVKYFNEIELKSGKTSNSNEQLSQKSNIDQKEIINKSSINNENEVIADFNLNDAKQVNHKLTYDENSTFLERSKAPSNEWKLLYFNQQEQIRLLNKQVELLNQIIRQ